MSGGLRCAHCREPIDPARAWRARTARRPFVETALHGDCVPAFCAAQDVRSTRPPVVKKRPHAVWCPRFRNADDACACGESVRPSPS